MRPPGFSKSDIPKDELRARNKAYRRAQKIAKDAEKAAKRALVRARGPRAMQVVIDIARVRNSAPIARVHVDAWRLAYRAIMPEKILRALTYNRFEQKWDELIAAAPTTGIFTLIAIEEEEGIIGFVRAGPSDEKTADGAAPIRPYEVFSINVAPKYQKKGVGERLLKEAVARMRADGAESFFLWVLAANRPARWMFRKRDGIQEGRGFDKLGPVRLPKVAYVWDEIDSLLVDYRPETFDPALLESIQLPAPSDPGPEIPELEYDDEDEDLDVEVLDEETAADVEALAEAGT